MISRDVSRLYPLAPRLYATSNAAREGWESLTPEERQRYVELAHAGEAHTQAARNASAAARRGAEPAA
jgi:hypothetical protein